MNEALLQYIWQYSLYTPNNLLDDSGKVVTVIHPGFLNTDEGPDFCEAKIRIDNVELVGNVELHVMSSDWNLHNHSSHSLYKNIILHVVYENNLTESLGNFSTLQLKQHISSDIISGYTQLMQNAKIIACDKQANAVQPLKWENWKERLLIERWQAKTIDWKQDFNTSNNDWKQLLYQRLAYNFGFKVNSIPFYELAKSLPIQLIEKHADNTIQTEALLFGQAGMLQKDFKDEYPNLLKKEYQFLQHKYNLQPITQHWKFLRMRPVNFPTIRIAQFAQVIQQSHHIFPKLLSTKNYKELYEIFDCNVSDYFLTHFTFDNVSPNATSKHLGKKSIENIAINTIVTFQFFYGKIMDNEQWIDNALALIDEIPAEQNSIISQWKSLGILAKNARDTQALLQLFNNYCTPKRCLNCNIGNAILKK